jgi:hypothetical protein
MADRFRVKHEVWLATETERVKAILLTPRYWGVKWTRAKLRDELAGIGLMYSPAEIGELNDALHAAGVVEDIVEAGATPE